MAPDRRPDRAAAGRDAAARALPRQGVRRRAGARGPRLPAARAAGLPGAAASTRSASSRGPSTRAPSSPSASSRCWASTRSQRLQGWLPLNPSAVESVPPFLAFNTAVELRHQHQLAELRRRVDDEPPRPDGGADRAELRLGRGRHGGRRRPDPRLHAPARGDHRQLLGRPDAGRDPRAAAAGARARRRARRPRRRADAQGPVGGDHRGGRDADHLPWARSPARSRSRSWAPTAAASSTPTRRIRSRTRPASRTSSRSWRCCSSRSRSPTPSAAWSATSARAGRSSRHVRALGGVRRRRRRTSRCSGNPRVEVRRPANMEGKEVRFGRRDVGALRGLDHRHLDRRGELRRTTASRPVGGAVPLVNMHARRGLARRRRGRALRHARLRPAGRVHLRPHGRAHARVPRQEDPGGGDEARRPVPPRGADPGARLARRVGAARSGQGVDPQPRSARADRGRLRVRLAGQQQRLGLRRPDRQHRLVQRDRRRSRCSPAGSS